MPAKDSRAPDSRRMRVLNYFQAHPGFHRCQDVAKALGEDTHPVAVAARNLMLRGDVVRHYVDNPTGAKHIPVYGIDPSREQEPVNA